MPELLSSFNRNARPSWVGFMLTFMLLVNLNVQAQTTATSPVGTRKTWGVIDGITIEGLVQGPSAAESSLQVACLFEYTEDDIFKSPPALPPALNGLVHLDEALKGQLTEIRKSGRFAGHALETLLLTPKAGSMKAPRVLLIGLGDRQAFTPELMSQVGAVALREAVRLGVSHFAFASDLKDAGIDSPTALVAEKVTQGIVGAYRSELYLKSKGLSTFKPVAKVTLLAGPAFFTTAGEGIQKALSSLQSN